MLQYTLGFPCTIGPVDDGAVGLAWLWALPLNGFLGVGAYWAARHGFRQPESHPPYIYDARLPFNALQQLT